MEVTNENFDKGYDILENEIENADFIAIDGEFSGLSTIRHRAPGYNTTEEMYEKTRVGSGRMMLLQYGISLFSWNNEKNHYEAMPFTFYIFPRPYKKFGNDIIFTSQSSSLDFLAHHGFDFNKLFHKGISFMTPYAEEKARENIEREMAFHIEKEKQSMIKPSQAELNGESKVFIPKDQREFINTILETVKTFVKDESRNTIDLPPCTPFQRKLIFERLEELYPLGLYLESATNEDKQKFVRGHKTLAGYKKNIEEKQKNEQKLLEESIGFSKVMKLISKSKKPIIGHNMFLDMFFTYTNFFGEPPLTLRSFKESLAKLFPIIIDTKFIASLPPVSHVISSTSVQKLVDNIEEEKLPNPSVVISEKLKEEGEYTKKFHDAGYDAFSTGRIFISVAKHLFSHLGQPTNRIDLSSDNLSQYINCIYVMGICDIFHTDLCKEDTIPDRHNVFYIRFPPSWKAHDIRELFSPYCSLNSRINWINDESVFVTINEDGKYDDIFKNLVMSSGTKVATVLPYNYYIRNKDPRDQERQSTEGVPSKRKKMCTDVEEGEISSESEENECTT